MMGININFGTITYTCIRPQKRCLASQTSQQQVNAFDFHIKREITQFFKFEVKRNSCKLQNILFWNFWPEKLKPFFFFCLSKYICIWVNTVDVYMYPLYGIMIWIPHISFVARTLSRYDSPLLDFCYKCRLWILISIYTSCRTVISRIRIWNDAPPFVGPYGKMINRFQHSSKDNTGTTDMNLSSLCVPFFLLA